ncbi:MAG: hypothetical protein ACXWTL_01090 [Methylobacter sp.]
MSYQSAVLSGRLATQEAGTDAIGDVLKAMVSGAVMKESCKTANFHGTYLWFILIQGEFDNHCREIEWN